MQSRDRGVMATEQSLKCTHPAIDTLGTLESVVFGLKHRDCASQRGRGRGGLSLQRT